MRIGDKQVDPPTLLSICMIKHIRTSNSSLIVNETGRVKPANQDEVIACLNGVRDRVAFTNAMSESHATLGRPCLLTNWQPKPAKKHHATVPTDLDVINAARTRNLLNSTLTVDTVGPVFHLPPGITTLRCPLRTCFGPEALDFYNDVIGSCADS